MDSYSVRVWKSEVWGQFRVKIKMLARSCSFWCFRGKLFLAFSSLWWLLAVLGLWPHHWNLCFCGHTAPSFAYVKSPYISPVSTFVIASWPSQIIQDNLTIQNPKQITFAKSLSHTVALRHPRIRTWGSSFGLIQTSIYSFPICSKAFTKNSHFCTPLCNFGASVEA